ncbi:MAG: hypothetical protein S0880_32095 [Actinomycetota bacterium]|nr:hypothetical protein [Actinomycetota bacterium]
MAGVVDAVTGSRWRAVGVGIVLGLALLGAAVPLTAFGGGDPAGEIFLAPANEVGPNPFTDALS